MLVPEMDPLEREGVKQIAEAMVSALAPAAKDEADQKARPIVEYLRDVCGSEVAASRVASLIGDLFAALSVMDVGRLSGTLDSGVICYALAAAHLAGVRDLPERKLDLPDFRFN